jgi:hypothetical protein
MDSADEAIARLRKLNGARIQLTQIEAIATQLARLISDAFDDIDLSEISEAADKVACDLAEPPYIDVDAVKDAMAREFRDQERAEQRGAA